MFLSRADIFVNKRAVLTAGSPFLSRKATAVFRVFIEKGATEFLLMYHKYN